MADISHARGLTMNSWRSLIFLILTGGIVAYLIYLAAKDIGLGKVSSPEAICILTLICLFGALMGNYRRTQLLDDLLLTLVYALVALGEWFHTHSSLSPTLWGIFALLWAFRTRSEWKRRRTGSAGADLKQATATELLN
jgi:4-amino-4-deoxy-L-arabinose transferase-like glycosyltransferase